MENKRLVMCTSTGCIDFAPERYKKYNIQRIRVRIIFNGEEIEEGPEFDPVKFYNDLETIKDPKNNLPHTDMPKPEVVLNQFQKAYEEGYNELIIIAISSGLGGTYNELCLLAKEFEDKMKITVIDSKITCFGEGLLAIKAAQMVEEGRPTEEIVKEIEWIKARQEFIGIDARLDYLIYNGRLKGAKALMGRLLKICPVIHFDREGMISPYMSVRTQKRALHKTCELLKQEILKDRDPKDYLLWHTYTGPSVVEELKEIEKEYGIVCNHEDVIMSPVSGCHNGPWLAGYCYFPIRREDEPLE